MIRRLFAIASAFSLVFCVATAILWVRSYRIPEAFSYGTFEREDEIFISRGAISLELLAYSKPTTGWNYRTPGETIFPICAQDINGDPDWRFVGSEYSPSLNLFVLPLWSLCLLFILAPLAKLSMILRRDREGCCTRCGYDLRATPDRCPECGYHLPATG